MPAELCRAAGVEPGADLVAEVQTGRIVLESRRLPIWERIAALTADTFYWVAVLSPRDPFHAQVMSWGRNLGTTRLITTDEVLNGR